MFEPLKIPQYNNSLFVCIPSFKILAIIVPEKTVTQKNLTELRSYVITEFGVFYFPNFPVILTYKLENVTKLIFIIFDLLSILFSFYSNENNHNMFMLKKI